MEKEDILIEIQRTYKIDMEYLRNMPGSVYDALNEKLDEGLQKGLNEKEAFKEAYYSQSTAITAIYQCEQMIYQIRDFDEGKSQQITDKFEWDNEYASLRSRALDVMANADFVLDDLPNKEVRNLVYGKINEIQNTLTIAYCNQGTRAYGKKEQELLKKIDDITEDKDAIDKDLYIDSEL